MLRWVIITWFRISPSLVFSADIFVSAAESALMTAHRSGPPLGLADPGYMSRKFESFERINSIRETNGNFGSCNSCKRLGTSRLHEFA